MSYDETHQHVFRAILKEKFQLVGGFAINVGYTDDWSLSHKLGVLASLALGAKYFHRNPDTLPDVWRQARWVGKNEFLTGNIVRRFYNLYRYFPLFSPFKGLWGFLKYHENAFLIFKTVYDSAVFLSVLSSFIVKNKHK